MRGLAIVDLEPIRNLQIHYLNLTGTAVRNLEPLRNNMYLRELNLTRTKVSDLSPLKNLEIYALNLSGTAVDDLSTLLTLTQLTKLDLSGLGHLDPAVVIDLLPQLQRVILPMQWRGKMGVIPLGLDVGWSNMPKMAAF